MQGRKPLPTVIKERRGTLQPCRTNKNEASFPVPGRMPSPPDDLTPEGKELWRGLGKMLLDAGLFTDGDRIALEMLCISYGRMKQANRQVAEKGTILKSIETGNIYQNPYLHVANKAWDQVSKLLAQFGLTPAERTRVLAAVQNDEEDDLYSHLFGKVTSD